jgi:hypothetical protein
MKINIATALSVLGALALAAGCSSSEDPSPGGSSAGDAGSSGDSGETGSGATGAAGSGATGGSSGKGGSGSGGKSDGSGGKGNTAGSTASGSGGLPPEVPPRAEPGTCGLDEPAFCEEFEEPKAGGRGGQIDDDVWAFSRYGHVGTQFFTRILATYEPEQVMPSVFCGQPFTGLRMPDDVAVCDGVGADGLTSTQLNEVYDDQGDFAFNSFRARQLFDFTDREGTITFDVDAKINPYNLGHGWWIEVFITEDTAPMPYHESPGVLSYPKNGIGFAFQGLNSCPEDKGGRSGTEVSRVFVTENWRIVHDFPGYDLEQGSESRCFKAEDRKLNRFKIVISQDKAEVWASDFDDPLNVRKLVTAEPLDLSFTRGYVHFQHSQYNARKDGDVTGVQTYRWDNIGFDGPTYAMPRSYEIADNDAPSANGEGRHYGYYLTDDDWLSVPIEDVDLSGANKATLSFSFFMPWNRGLVYRFNGGPEHTFIVPEYGSDGHILRGFAVDVPIEELVDGDNTIEMMATSMQDYQHEAVANMDLTIEAVE